MLEIIVDSRIFQFPDDWYVIKYDDTPYYKNHLKNKCGLRRGLKAVDLVAYDPNSRTLYLIESKDYRVHRREKPTPPDKEFSDKVIDTLTGLIPTALCGTTATAGEKELREGIQGARKLRLIYQFEQPRKHSKLFPRVYDPADLTDRLKKTLRCFDPHVLVVDAARQHMVRWRVE